MFLTVTVDYGSTATVERMVNLDHIDQVLCHPNGRISLIIRGCPAINLTADWTKARLEPLLPMVVEARGGPSAAPERGAGTTAHAAKPASPKRGSR